MAVEPQDAIFSLTPPPSDIDDLDLDKSGLLTCSPRLTGLCYPSPSPSNRGHASSVSSDSLYLLPELPILDHTQQLTDMAYNTSSSDSSSYYPLPAVSDPSLSQYSTTSGGSYAMYEPNQWYPYSTYSQPSQMLHYDPSASSHYPALDHQQVQPTLTNIIPPTPQDIQRSPFDFNSAPSTLPSNHHLTASPSFSHVSHHSSHSHRSSISSLSRSCSPSASSAYQPTTRGHSGDHFALRGSLRSNSTSSNTSLHAYGIPVNEVPLILSSTSLSPQSGSQGQAWRCAYPGCTSRATFTRGCDLRKHYNRHSKHLFCRVEGCPQSEAAAAGRAKSTDQPLSGGFSSKKDRARHEAKHNPGIKCEWRGLEGEECGRVFSRMDNMKDHVRRIHNKGQAQSQQQSSQRHAHIPASGRK